MSSDSVAAAPVRLPRTERLGRELAGWRGWALGAAVLLVLSTLIVVWARTRPGFDPYGWLVWGQQTLKWALDTNAAPSWKPLPYLLTVPFALAGHYQLWLWMITVVAATLAGAVFGGRIAFRLVAPISTRRHAPAIAAIFAAAGVMAVHNYAHFYLSAQSDSLIAALCLAAVDCHLNGRFRWALILGLLASLGRPEAWPFAGLYAVWAWRAVPSMRWLIAGGVVTTGLLWFGIPALTSRSAFQAGTAALHSGRALKHDKIFGTIDRFLDLQETPMELAALLSVALALWRRDRVTLALAAGTAGWVVVEIAFSLHGWPGNGRYMFPAAAALAVIAAVAVGRLLGEPPALRHPAGIAGLAAVALLLVFLAPSALTHWHEERTDLHAQRLRTEEVNKLHGAISRAGGATLIRSCGEPLTRLEYQSIVAWNLQVNVATVGFRYARSIARGYPIVLITPEPNGWKIQGVHQRTASCLRLPR